MNKLNVDKNEPIVTALLSMLNKREVDVWEPSQETPGLREDLGREDISAVCLSDPLPPS